MVAGAQVRLSTVYLAWRCHVKVKSNTLTLNRMHSILMKHSLSHWRIDESMKLAFFVTVSNFKIHLRDISQNKDEGLFLDL